MASFSVYREELRDGSVETWSRKETITWGPCTSPPTLEKFSKNERVNSFQYQDSGFTKEEEEDDDEEDEKDDGDREIAYGQILWGNAVLDEVPFVILGVF